MLMFFFKNSFFEKLFQEYHERVSNSLDPDHTQCFVWPDLGPDCLQGLSADDLSRQRVEIDLYSSHPEFPVPKLKKNVRKIVGQNFAVNW